MENIPHAAHPPPSNGPVTDALPPASRAEVTDRVSSGKRFFLRGDGRSRESRRLISLYRRFKAALPGAPTVAQDACLRALATITLELELTAARQAQGEAVDAQTLVSLVNVQGRLLERLSIAPIMPDPPKHDPDAHLAKIRDPEYWRAKRGA